eukprot:CAMPEP_0178451490 /NCGR_PEP_ID=MMETSP0689_2-20121128/43716_1 /TAXON_ID=160604 /ORGANISM="Amphidinium massartii, Strain CS-259" /LENGTH=325 /DNA_ID=CAMNT_0020077087 /DNA_START=1 /DNA_END=978 /DNA_ORIENTATION=+
MVIAPTQVMRAVLLTLAMQISGAASEASASAVASSQRSLTSRIFKSSIRKTDYTDSKALRGEATPLTAAAEALPAATALHHVQQQVVSDSDRSGMNGTRSSAHLRAPSCGCEANNAAWVPCARTIPECVFIDLGAANGNTFQQFIQNGYGPVANCPSAKWRAVLVEANPRFNVDLANLATYYGASIDAKAGTAAYMCEGQTSFYVDTKNVQQNYWGSSMSPNHPDAQASGHQQVVVPTMNLNRYLYENTIPGDWVMVKMDIEGAEWDVVPCLAQSPAASLIDRMYLEEHPQSFAETQTTPEQMQAAKATLASLGVDIPAYFSHTL